MIFPGEEGSQTIGVMGEWLSKEGETEVQGVSEGEGEGDRWKGGELLSKEGVCKLFKGGTVRKDVSLGTNCVVGKQPSGDTYKLVWGTKKPRFHPSSQGRGCFKK